MAAAKVIPLHRPLAASALVLGLLVSLAAPVSAESGESAIKRKNLSMTTQIDAGKIIAGRGVQPQAGDVSDKFLQRMGVWLTQEATIRDRFLLKMGVGGLFWYSLPDAPAGSLAEHKLLTKFGPGISQAQAIYRFGNPERPSASLQMGLFPYKYNPEVQNLGEYLLRSGTYPGTLRTGGWNLFTSSNYMVQGFRFNLPLWDGKFQSDFLLPMERDLPPMHDISPTYVATLAPFAGLELGGGVTWNHGIPVQPSKTSPRDNEGDILRKNPGNSYFVKVPNTDPMTNQKYPYVFLRDSTRFYTFQGIKLMGRASIDPKAWMGQGPFGKNDLKLYAEAAVLGWKNYPGIYEKRAERIPLMGGFNIPTFGLLEVLALEIEHYGSKFPNNYYQPYNNRLPIPHWSEDWPSRDSVVNYNPNSPEITRDDWKWSVYARRDIIRGIRLFAQAASDHMRPYEYNLYPFWAPVTNRNGKDWYFLFRLEFGV